MRSLGLILALGLTCMKAMAGSDKILSLRVIETSDVHGRFFPYNFTDGAKPVKGTLARVSSYVRKQREQYGDYLLLIDNGDILQGEPTNYWSNFVRTDRENIAAQVVNYMGYDAQTVGNHDIEPGHAVYDKWIREVRCPSLGANIVTEETGQPYVKPYALFVRDGVKIAVIGLLTPAIPHWLNEPVWYGLEFQEMVSCAKRWVKHLKEVERCDLVLGLFHSGLCGGITTDSYEENASQAVAREVPGFDVIFFGHDHQEHALWVDNCQGGRVLMLDPSCWARKVSEADIRLTYRDGTLIKKEIEGRNVDVSDMVADQQMMDYFMPQIEEIKAYCNRVIGRFETAVYTRDSFFGNSAFSDLIHNLQLQLTGADISLTAPLAFDNIVQAGPVTVADMFKLYRFENNLFVLSMTGEEVRRHLEMSYGLWTNQMKSADDHIMLLADEYKNDQQRQGFKNYTFNFDSACGIDYEVDVTKPEGQKVRIIRMTDGRPFDEQRWYRVVMSNYRANGGGELLTRGAGIPKDSLPGRIVSQTMKDQRYYLMKEIERLKTVAPKPNSNWRFVPDEWAKPALERDRKLIFGQ